MGMIGSIGNALKKAGSNFQANGGFNGLAAALDDTPGAWQDFQDQRRKNAQLLQQQQAFQRIMDVMKPQDTQSPVINNMVDAANQRMMGYNGGAQQQMGHVPVGKAGLDFSDPNTIKALGAYMGAGGTPNLPFAISEAMQPEKPQEPKYFNTSNAVVAVDPITGLAKPVYEVPVDPLKKQLTQAQINATIALENQRKHAAGKPYFKPATGGGRSAGPASSSGASSTLSAIEAELRRRGKIQ